MFRGFPRGRSFLPRRQAFLGPESLEPAAGRLGARLLVLSRGLCRFGRFDYSRVPASKRRGALALKLPTWAPFRSPAYAVVWADGVASVWGWDSTRLATELARHGHRGPAPARVLPETLLQSPGADGLRLVRCRQGFDAQHWQQGQLLASRWWPEAPDAAAWLAFLRDMGVAPPEQVPLPGPEAPPALPEPWGRVQRSAPGEGAAPVWERWAYAALALALGVPAVVLGEREWQYREWLAQLRGEVESLQQAATPLLAAREQALTALERIREIENLQPTPDPLSLMAAMARNLPADGAALREWDMADGTLRIVVASPSGPIAGAEVVAALEKTRFFSGAKMITQADPRVMGFSMRVLSLDELNAADPAAAASSATPAGSR